MTERYETTKNNSYAKPGSLEPDGRVKSSYQNNYLVYFASPPPWWIPNDPELVALEKPPEWYVAQNGAKTPGHFYGNEIEAIDQEGA